MPSRTALRVALRRAAHQLYDSPKIFDDPIAIPILGAAYSQELQRTPTRPDRPFSTGLRAFLVARSRYAEDNLAHAVASGVTQYVLLGAGLDTFAYRNPWPHLRVFEVDHPATQEWKRELLDTAKIPIPANLTFAPVDFETQAFPEELSKAGFDSGRAAFFAWLGVVPYLTLSAFRATITFVTEHAVRNKALSNIEAITSIRRTGISLDYGQPRSALPLLEQLAHDSLGERVRLAGEPFQLFFTPQEIAAELSAFSEIEDIGSGEINGRYFAQRDDNLSLKGSAGRFLTAWL